MLKVKKILPKNNLKIPYENNMPKYYNKVCFCYIKRILKKGYDLL